MLKVGDQFVKPECSWYVDTANIVASDGCKITVYLVDNDEENVDKKYIMNLEENEEEDNDDYGFDGFCIVKDGIVFDFIEIYEPCASLFLNDVIAFTGHEDLILYNVITKERTNTPTR